MNIIQSWFGPRIDNETVVEIWKLVVVDEDEKDYASLALAETTTWVNRKKDLLKILDIPINVYGLQEPMIVVFASYYGQMLCLLFTTKEFQEKLGDLPVHTPEEQMKFVRYFISKSELAILGLEKKKLEIEIQICDILLKEAEEIKRTAESLKR